MGHEMVLHKRKIWAEAKHNLDQVSGISSSRVKWALFLSFFSLLPICDFNPLVFFRKPPDEVGFLRAEYICYTQVISVECFLPSFPEKNHNKLLFQTLLCATPKELKRAKTALSTDSAFIIHWKKWWQSDHFQEAVNGKNGVAWWNIFLDSKFYV